ncbi:MAG: hypothetical protein NTW05_20545 [Pseudonocardiales bacterium]|jgi:hypothetical protein|nr:hypothetical protein [Pseudonocardiales bacterium]
MAVGTTAQRGIGALASVLRVIGMAIVAVLVVHIVLTLLSANPDVWLVALVRDLADTFNLGLANLFQPAEPKLAVALNYGTAALIWFVLTSVVVRLVRRIG